MAEGGWAVNTHQADMYDTTASANDRITSRGGTRGGSKGSYDPGKYNVVGINATNAKSSADALVTGTKEVMSQIDKIQMESTLLDGAVKGPEVQEALKNYLNSVKAYCSAVVSDVNAFADKLYEVSRVWEESQKKFAAESIQESATSSFSGNTTTAYQNKEAGV